MSDEFPTEFEDYGPEQKGFLFGDIAMVTLALGINFVLLTPFLLPQRTMGASTTDYLDRRGKPLLLELRNCRVVSQEPASPALPPLPPREPAGD